MDNNSIRRAALEAARIIERDGLAKGVFVDGNWRKCVTAALGYALGFDAQKNSRWTEHPDYKDVELAFYKYLEEHKQVRIAPFQPVGCFGAIIAWNDAAERSGEIVADTLRDFAESLNG
jgi:hypothetical protein